MKIVLNVEAVVPFLNSTTILNIHAAYLHIIYKPGEMGCRMCGGALAGRFQMVAGRQLFVFYFYLRTVFLTNCNNLLKNHFLSHTFTISSSHSIKYILYGAIKHQFYLSAETRRSLKLSLVSRSMEV